MRRLILGGIVLVLLVAACTGAAHLKALQPPVVPSSPPITVLGATALWHYRAHSPLKMQLGIDIDLYTYPGQNFAAAAATDVAYIANLHANAVSISFPFFMVGPNAARLYASSATPTPTQLAILVHDAKQAGLYVSIRPLLDETSLGISRPHWIPAHLSAWFASYREFLLPYAAMARRQHVNEFIVGTEFSRFSASPRWNALDSALRRRFHGTLGCANNWDGALLLSRFAGNCGRGARESVDAYHPEHGNLTAGWEKFDRALPSGTVETEVGIGAVKGAYRRPYQYHWQAGQLDQSVQARWFTAACRAAVRTHLGGIYFWPLGFNQTVGNGPTLAYQGLWAGGQGAQAIATCFATLGRKGQ